jgi:hypothetical protein
VIAYFGIVQGVELIVASNETHIFDMHLKNMGKQKVAWKPHGHNSTTWAYFKVNNNQLMDLF